MEQGLKRLLPFAIAGGVAGIGGAAYLFMSEPNPAAERLASSGGFSSSGVLDGHGSDSHAHGDDEEDGMLPGRLRRAQTGRAASSQFANANYGESSLNLVGGKLSIDEAMELEGGRKALPESGDMSSGGVKGAEGMLGGHQGQGQGSHSIFGEVGGFDKKSSKLDETADYYGKRMQGGSQDSYSKEGGNANSKNPMLARNAGASSSGVTSKAAAGGMARTSKSNVLKQSVGGQGGNAKNAMAGLKGAAGFVTGAAGGGSNFQTQAGILGRAIDGANNNGVIEGITGSEPAGISVSDLPSYDDPTAPSNQSTGKKLFDWEAKEKALGSTQRDWESLGDYSEVYADTMGLGGIMAQYLGFPGVVAGYVGSSSNSSGYFNSLFKCGKWKKKSGCNRTYTSVVEVTVNVDGNEKKVTSRASPFTATCKHKCSGCHDAGEAKKVDTIPFGEGRYLLIYNFFNHHAKPNPGLTGYLLNVPNVRANREPMFVPINANASKKYTLGPCLRSLAEEFAAKCGIGTIQQTQGLSDKLLEMNVSEADGGIRGACVQHYELPRKFEQCVNSNSGEWGM